MKIEDLVLLLNNRLREFKLSRDYAKMNGDLERLNAADKEIFSLEDTLHQLNLLIGGSKRVAEEGSAGATTGGSTTVLSEYDITSYATDPQHEEKIAIILGKIGEIGSAEEIHAYIMGKYWSSPVTGDMIWSSAEAYAVDARLMMAIMQLDSQFGTVGIAVDTMNPGNVGNTDDGSTRTYDSWQEGVTAVAEWLSRHRMSDISIVPGETIVEPSTTSTPAIVISTATSTPPIATTTPPTTSTSTPLTTPSTSSGQATSTPITATSTPFSTDTSTPTTTSTTTPTTIISTPTTATSTDSTSSPQAPLEQAATTTQETATSTSITSTTSTTTPVTATSTPN